MFPPAATQNPALNIGQMNQEAVERILGELRIPIVARDLGGGSGRHLTLDTASGIVASGSRGEPIMSSDDLGASIQSPGQPRGATMKRLLVVDDALFMRKLIRGVAVEAGWEVVGEAGNGEEAIALYAPAQARPGHHGPGHARHGRARGPAQIRELDPEAQVVVVTALDQKQALMDSIRDGAIDFIVKPFERERVLNLLRKLALEHRLRGRCSGDSADERMAWRNFRR